MVTANAAHTNTINHARNVDLIENFPAFYRISSQLARPKIKSFFTFFICYVCGALYAYAAPRIAHHRTVALWDAEGSHEV